jgi:4-hydroxybenzoate polyprenyltransferase
MEVRKILKSIWNEFVYGGHLLSLGGSGNIYFETTLLNQKINLLLLFLAYLISQIVYSYNHLIEAKKDIESNSERAKYLLETKKEKKAKIEFFIYCLFLLITLFLLKKTELLIFVLIIVIAGIFYTLFFKSLTKKVLGFKNLYVSFTWTFSLQLLIGMYYGIFNNIMIILFLFIFLRCMVNGIFFDLKDIKTDKNEGLKTLPVALGQEKTLYFLHIINFISFIPILFGVFKNILPFYSLSLFIFFFYSFYYLRVAEKGKSNLNFLSYVMVDAEHILWGLWALIFKLFI